MKRHSEAYEDIQPALMLSGKLKKAKPIPVTNKERARQLFSGMHAAVNYENHMEALSQ